jgi:hypothetical protein
VSGTLGRQPLGLLQGPLLQRLLVRLPVAKLRSDFGGAGAAAILSK